MWFRSLFDTLSARPARTPAQPRRPAPSVRQRPRAVRPLLEVLEDRTLLSTYVVDAVTDTGAGSGLTGDLRYCITNATSGNDTITFGVTGTIQLESALPALNTSVAIQGPGANQLTVERDPASLDQFGIFAAGSAATVQISGLTIADGTAVYGGAIYNAGALTVSNSTLSGNSAYSPDYSPDCASGGAIYNAGALTVNNSTISGNTAIGPPSQAFGGSGTTGFGGGGYGGPGVAGNGYGGGIYASGGTLTINSSTIADNEASGGSSARIYGLPGDGYGGGLYIAGGTVSIDYSTLAGNQAVGGDSIYGYANGNGGGICNAAGPSALRVYDTIVADNTANYGPDLDGGVTSQGHNLIGNTTRGSGFVASDLLNANPDLGPLQNNGGPTQTMALLAGSSAVNTGDNTNAPACDQRGPGFPRIVGGFIDIGAFEVQDSSPTQASSLAVAGFPSVITAGSAGSFTVTALNADGTTDTSYTDTVRFSSSDVQAGLPAIYTFTAADGGVHTFSATLKTAGTQSITVTDLTFGTTGTETGINVTPGAASQLAFVQQPSTTTAGQAIRPSVTVDVEDPYGNLVGSDSSTVTVTLNRGTFAGGSNTASAQASGGVATFSTLEIDKAGSYTLWATDGSLTPTRSASFTIQPATASSMTVAGFPSPTTAGAVSNFTVTLEDPYGNIASGYTGTVHFTSSDGKATLPANYTFTAADAGKHTFSATLKTAGTQSITATDTATASLTGTDSGITVNPAAASQFILSAPAGVSPGVSFSLTLTVEDAYGNVVTGYTGTVHFSSKDSTATLPSNYTFTAADKGVHTFSGLVLRKKGNQKVTITDTSNSSLTGSIIVGVL
jgi:hypothetical protein